MKRYGWWFNKELCESRIGSRRETTIQDYIRNKIEGLSSDHKFNEVMTFIIRYIAKKYSLILDANHISTNNENYKIEMIQDQDLK